MKRLVVGLVFAASLSLPTAGAQASPGTDVVLEWNAIMTTTTGTQNPFAQARIAAITQLAVFEAVNAINGQFDSYLAPLSAPAGASVEAAAVTAAHDALVNYVPAAASSLDAAQAASLSGIADGRSKDDGIAVGAAAAAQLIAVRTGDGSGPARFYQPTSTDAGVWQTTPSCPAAGGALFHWQNLTPFGIKSTAQFRSAQPPALSSPDYARDYDEVMRVGGANSDQRSAHQADVVHLFAALLAPTAWNSIARQLANESGTSLVENARILALVNMAMSDALAAVMETKYHYVAWRPETAIRAGGSDGNDRTTADPTFTPFITSPCFPAYGSAHASASYAARSILERVWGNGGHSLELSHAAVPGKTFSYTSLKQITDDIDDARVYGGIHFRFDQEAGATQGRRIAQYVFAHNLLALQP